MISTKLSAIIIFFGMVCCDGIKSHNTYLETIYDADSLPLLKCQTNKLTHLDSCIFIKTNGENIPVDFKIKYSGGIDSLVAFCDRKYFQILGENFQELNEKIQYYILFDNKVKINEIRIYRRSNYIGNKYDNIIKDVLLKTEGNWVKENI